ncbi:MAG: pilus assembly protein PilM [bacterium]
MFSKTAIGLDIADTSIEVVELGKKVGRFEILSMNRTELNHGIIENGRIMDKKALSSVIAELMKNAKPKQIKEKKINVVLPNSHVFTHIFSFENSGLNRDEQNDIILQETLTNIPLSHDNLIYSHQIIKSGKKKATILIAAADAEATREWNDFLLSQKFEFDFFDIEPLATFRGLYNNVKTETQAVGIVDIGAITTNIYFFNKQGLCYSYCLHIAGNQITGEIASKFNKKWEQAEEIKKKFAFSKKNDKVYPIVVNIMDQIIEEIKNSTEYYEKRNDEKISTIILVGGGSQISEIDKYFKAKLDKTVMIGQSEVIKTNKSQQYIEAVGLALKGLKAKKDYGKEINIPLPEKFKKNNAKGEQNKDTKEFHPKQSKQIAVSIEQSDASTLINSDENEKLEDLEFDPREDAKTKKLLKVLLVILILGVVIIAIVLIARGLKKPSVQSAINNIMRSSTDDIKLESNSNLIEKNNNSATTSAQIPAGSSTTLISTSTSDNRTTGLANNTLVSSTEIMKQYVEIKPTETGWLNAREGPGTNYSIVSKVKPGEIYELLQEQSNWYKININTSTWAWVISQYAEKQ